MNLAQKLAVNYWRAKLNIIAMVSRPRAARKAFDLFCTPMRKSKKKASAIFLKGEKIQFELDDITVKGYRWNHPKPHRVLLVHGFESTIKNFDRFVAPLLKKGYEVLAFDAPAHGRSGGKRINLPMYIRTLQHIGNQFGPISGYIAHSFGGLALAHYLEKIDHDESTRAVWIAPATETVTAIDSFFGLLGLDPGVRTEFDKLIYEISGLDPTYYSIRRAMNQIKASVLWIHDKDDPVTPLRDALQVKKDNHPNISWLFTEGLGHRRIYRDDTVVSKIVDFL